VASVSDLADPLSADSPLTLKTKKKKPAATADQVAVYAEKNQRLLYARPKDGALVEVDVLSVLQTIWYVIFVFFGTRTTTLTLQRTLYFAPRALPHAQCCALFLLHAHWLSPIHADLRNSDAV